MKFQVKLRRVDEVTEPIEADDVQDAVRQAENSMALDGHYRAISVDDNEITGHCEGCGQAIFEDSPNVYIDPDMLRFCCNCHEFEVASN